MATFTSSAFDTTNRYIKYKIIVTENSVDEVNNKRNVTVKVFVYRTNTGYTTYGTGAVYCYIDGTTYTASISNSQTITNSGINLFTKTLDIPFNADGTKQLKTSAYIKHSRFESASHSFSPWLTEIPRASSITVGAGTLGTAQTITITPAVATFKHTLSYTCGTASGTIGTEKTSATSVLWVPPLDLAKQNISGTSVNATVTCKTYSGDTLIGEKSVNVMLNIPTSVAPDASLTITDAEGYFDTFGAFIQSKSRFNIGVQTTTAYGASISKVEINANGAVYKSTPTVTDVITGTGQQTITATVTDSRGRTKTVTQAVNVLEYNPPAITALEPRRCDEDGSPNEQGEFVKVTYAYIATALNDVNRVTLLLLHKKTSETSWQTETLISSQAIYTATADVIIPADDMNSYDIRLRIKDLLSDFIDADTSASTAFSILTIGASGRVISFGKSPEIEEGVEFGFDAFFNNGIHLPNGTMMDYIIETGETNGYKYRKSASGIIELWGDIEVTFPASTVIGGNNRSIAEVDLSNILSKIIGGNCLIQDIGTIPTLCRRGSDPTIAELIILSPAAISQKTITVPIYVIGEI